MPSKTREKKIAVLPSGIPDIAEVGVSEDIIKSRRKKKSGKKRSVSEVAIESANDADKPADEDIIDEDLDEPTLGDKVATLMAQEKINQRGDRKVNATLESNPPLADSISVLLKQALRADDHNLLMDCLFTQDEKVISNSVSSLDSSDVLNFLNKLMSIIHSRGAILACTVPWLKALLLQHASGVMSQHSSLLALNSLNQLIKSRVATFEKTLELSSYLDFLYPTAADELIDETEIITPAIYEDDSDEVDNSDDSDPMEDDGEEEIN